MLLGWWYELAPLRGVRAPEMQGDGLHGSCSESVLGEVSLQECGYQEILVS